MLGLLSSSEADRCGQEPEEWPGESARVHRDWSPAGKSPVGSIWLSYSSKQESASHAFSRPPPGLIPSTHPEILVPSIFLPQGPTRALGVLVLITDGLSVPLDCGVSPEKKEERTTQTTRASPGRVLLVMYQLNCYHGGPPKKQGLK